MLILLMLLIYLQLSRHDVTIDGVITDDIYTFDDVIFDGSLNIWWRSNWWHGCIRFCWLRLLCTMQGAEGAVADGHEPPSADALDR